MPALDMKAVISTSNGDSYQKEIAEEAKQALIGLQIGEELDGSLLGLNGYKLEIKGGSDKQGFPMRKSVEGSARRNLMLKRGAGISRGSKQRKRKTVRGRVVSDGIEQLNLKVVKTGDKKLEELLSPETETEEE